MPNPFTEDEIRRALDADTMTRAFRARLEASRMDLEELSRRFQEDAARTLLCAGITLIPSEHLSDNQFVVSRGVYEAAKKITGI